MTDTNIHKRQGLFLAGTILLTICAAVKTFDLLFNFGFAGLFGLLGSIFITTLFHYVFLLGVILLWFSGKKLETKLIWTLIPATVIFCSQLYSNQRYKGRDETILIPQNYRGKVLIHFMQPCGESKQIENGRFIYKIPDNGILLLNYDYPLGFGGNQQFYTVDQYGKKTLLPQLNSLDYYEDSTNEMKQPGPSPNILGVINFGQRGSDGAYEFYVSTFKQLKDSFGWEYDKRYNSIEIKLLDSCQLPKK